MRLDGQHPTTPPTEAFCRDLMKTPIPNGWSVWEREQILSGDRPPWLVENEDEIKLAFANGRQAKLTCAYCGNRNPTRSSETKAILWWESHDCRTLEEAEAYAILLGVTRFPASDL